MMGEARCENYLKCGSNWKISAMKQLNDLVGGRNEVRSWFLGAFLLFILAFIHVGYAQSAGDDRACLIGLKKRLQDRKGSLASWNDNGLAIPCFNQSLTSLIGITCNGNRVYSIQLNGNGLGGVISSAISNCSFMSILDLSDNALTDEIGSKLGNLALLSTLNLSLNKLTGAIPAALTNCNYLNVLDLHDNELTGFIPQSFGFLQRLRVFDVSHNDLSGPVPISLANSSTGGLRFNITSFQGNKKLYGYPLPPLKQYNLSVLAIIGIGLGSGILSLILSFMAVCIWLRAAEQRLTAEEGKISQLVLE
ncbi:hypothetical protein O6H91_02G079000 [Diphasiastrum complanatum]|uniref:Uncharacterized protein n=1 Tax=Diphasiastrum complanatum TaxID=34168 RepID=A0ACC2EH92_DIPCM|nr:hypothetical protein O6H91_02G079000 [Diphasiastrum complanatum]